ncbi:MAG: hypothetical protein ACI4J0_01005 [Huintestinicola sp.]|uniref:hypothetical protein n=1 Tax=Huintestinicola sp. TaxID=2981661 RepID=UPI003F007F0B
MGISPIGTGTAAPGGFVSGGDTGTNIQRKLTELKKQREEFVGAQNKVTDKNALSNKIAALDRRISNLENRLEKLNEQNGECQTCKNRKYQDGSDDPGVSFKTASKVAPEAAASAVRGHEMEHVYRNRAEAAREGREVVSQSVRLKTGICPECGKAYISGGETRTVTKAKNEPDFSAGTETDPKGSLFDTVA